MRPIWPDLAVAGDGETIQLSGYPLAPGLAAKSSCFLIVPEPRCCAVHPPQDTRAAVEVFADSPQPMQAGALRLTGQLRLQTGDPTNWRYQLHAARSLDPPGWNKITRRGILASGPLMCLAASTAWAQASADPGRAEAARRVIAAGVPVDIHSHAGGIANFARLQGGVGFIPISAPMRAGGMGVICWAMVGDSGTHRLSFEGRIRPYRDPAPGELRAHAAIAFDSLHRLARSENLRVIATAADLYATRPDTPGVIISAEGADFLEGRIDGLSDAYHRWSLRHLQLTHYRVNELGDIQTEPPVHGGLTDFGAEVIRACNQMGIVVDVAHGTFDLVRRAVSVTNKPLVLSHTSLDSSPRPYSRHITPEHAKLVASTGGVIGVWPPAATFPSLASMAAGIVRMADAAGIDHVGLGSDMRGLTGASIFPDYDQLPALTAALLDAGLSQQDAVKVLGGNYARVFAASLKT